MTTRTAHAIQAEIDSLRSSKWSGDCSDFDYVALRIEELEDELNEVHTQPRRNHVNWRA
jgi:hypothetical protein